MLLETLRVSCSRWRNSDGTAEEQQNPALEGWCEHHHDGEWMDFAFRCNQYLWAGRVTISNRSNESNQSLAEQEAVKKAQSSPSSAKCQPRKATARALISNESSSRPRVPASPRSLAWLDDLDERRVRRERCGISLFPPCRNAPSKPRVHSFLVKYR